MVESANTKLIAIVTSVMNIVYTTVANSLVTTIINIVVNNATSSDSLEIVQIVSYAATINDAAIIKDFQIYVVELAVSKSFKLVPEILNVMDVVEPSSSEKDAKVKNIIVKIIDDES